MCKMLLDITDLLYLYFNRLGKNPFIFVLMKLEKFLKKLLQLKIANKTRE